MDRIVDKLSEFFIPLFDLYGFIFLSLFMLTLFLLETKLPLRKRVQSRLRRIFTNAGVAVPAFISLRLLLITSLVFLANKNQEWETGLLHLVQLPPAIQFIIGFFLLDYLNYVWHLLNHHLTLLWRFHNVHHTDLDLDVTTAFRFHFGEMIFSVFFRGAAVIVLGASPLLVLLYEIIFDAATAFHHSNWKLPFRLEKILNVFIVTPRMHGIHHSIVKDETDSNYSVIFNFWDRLHRTLRLNVHQDDIVIGTPAYQDAHELSIFYLLTLPFRKLRPWQLSNGKIPTRIRQYFNTTFLK